MKTTLDIPDELFHRAKKLALEQRTSLKAIVVKALSEFLGPHSDVRIPVHTHTWPPTDQVSSTLSSVDILQIIRLEREGKSFAKTSAEKPVTDEPLKSDTASEPTRKTSRSRKKS